ncbi:spore germination protein [Calidifontibacillus erzurumensis]|uniref:Spore germination protein n=1 Tax=Calidifontibacillus erzurumensis TaxID=2741433 RepID=A0A8J8GAI1_9BACI|nr:spore germination protein [Calidifontibacillus erzurumensis]NSL50340.1 spore germination protein [Calidifontibacillus erzurumensis]
MLKNKEIQHPVQSNIDANVQFLREQLGVGKSFDVIHLDLEYAGRKMAMFLIDGFVKDDLIHLLQKFLAKLSPEHLEPDPLDKLLKTYIPYVEVDKNNDLDVLVDTVLAGPTVLLIDGIDYAIIIDARTYPVRGPEEPDTERVVRGSRDGYVETIVFNTALTRRRVRDRSLRMEYMQVGRRSKTDVCVCYLEDIADPDLVKEIKESLSKIDTDGLPMAEKTIEEFIGGRHLNPYPIVRFTERPDTAASHLFEGHVIVIIDGSPSVMIAPTTFWHHLQHAEEYRQKPIVGAYLRLIRFLAVWASMFLLPLWYLFSVHPEYLPIQLDFIGPKEPGEVPLLIQLILAEVGIDILRMAAVHTPSSLATALGLVAALMIGQVAVEVGLFTNETVLYIAIAAIGTFATPSYELSLANRLVRIVFLLMAGWFGLIGFCIAITLWLIMLVRMKSFQTPYFWPFIPFSFRDFKDVFIRTPIPLKKRRPTILHPQDPDR